MKKALKNLTLLTLLYGGLTVFLINTNPTDLSISWLILPFIWLYVAIFFTVRLLIKQFARQTSGQAPKRQFNISAVAAAIPTLMLLLNSINQLTLKDVMLILALGSGGLFYATKLHLRRPSS